MSRHGNRIVVPDYPDPRFIQHLLNQQPAPKDRVTHKKMWDKGMKLFGAERDDGQRAMMFDPYMFKHCAGGVRGGKSEGGAWAIYQDSMWRKDVRQIENDIYGVIGDTYEMAKEEMRHLSRYYTNAGIPHKLSKPKNASWDITFPDCDQEIVTLSGDDEEKIASRPYRAIVVGEAMQADYAVIENAEDRIEESRGWMLSEGTFEMKNKLGVWFRKRAVEWQEASAIGKFYSLPSWDNFVVWPGGRTDPDILRIERIRGPLRFMERYGGKPMKRSDSVMMYADRRWHVKRRFKDTSFDPSRPVFVFIDPGREHAFAVVAAQFVGNVCWVIDCVYRHQKTIDDIVSEVAMKEWSTKIDTFVFDHQGSRQNRSEGDAVMSQWAKAWLRRTGFRANYTSVPTPVRSGYELHNTALRNAWPEDEAQKVWGGNDHRVITDVTGPRVYFDPDAEGPFFGGDDVDGVEYLGEYELHVYRRTPEGEIAPGQNPIVDADNDAIKALSYGFWWYWGDSFRALDQRGVTGGNYSQPWEMVYSGADGYAIEPEVAGSWLF